jgi:hypothetical protein
MNNDILIPTLWSNVLVRAKAYFGGDLLAWRHLAFFLFPGYRLYSEPLWCIGVEAERIEAW